MSTLQRPRSKSGEQRPRSESGEQCKESSEELGLLMEMLKNEKSRLESDLKEILTRFKATARLGTQDYTYVSVAQLINKIHEKKNNLLKKQEQVLLISVLTEIEAPLYGITQKIESEFFEEYKDITKELTEVLALDHACSELLKACQDFQQRLQDIPDTIGTVTIRDRAVCNLNPKVIAIKKIKGVASELSLEKKIDTLCTAYGQSAQCKSIIYRVYKVVHAVRDFFSRLFNNSSSYSSAMGNNSKQKSVRPSQSRSSLYYVPPMLKRVNGVKQYVKNLNNLPPENGLNLGL